MYQFDGDTWKYNALMDYVAFKELHEFILNDVAADAHTNSYRLEGELGFAESQLNAMREHKITTLRDALTHFANQTIISLCTTFEVSIREFLRALFLTKPATMFDYLGNEDMKGYVPLKEIIQTTSYTDLIAGLADRASSVASKGKYGQVFIRALSICGNADKTELIEKLNTLQVERNKLIHERHRLNTGILEVFEAHSVVDAAIVELCALGASNGIPGRYTCVRSDIEIKLNNVALLVKDKV